MKILKISVISVATLGIIGFGIYYYGTNVTSVKILETVSTELEKNGQIEEIKNEIENDPEIKYFIEEGITDIDESKLPFTTKEEATKVLVKKVGVSEIADMKSKYESGTLSKDEALQVVQGKLTEEEIMALKIIVYKELNKE